MEKKQGQAAAGAAPRPVAVIDIGARAIRLDVAEISAEGHVRLLNSLQKPVSLGRDTYTEGRIDGSTIEECVDILRGFRDLLPEYGIRAADQVRAVATSSVREAENREAFVDRIDIATGIGVEVLEDPEVEHLIHLSLLDLLEQDPEWQKRDVLVVEAGGGTTRLLLIQGGTVTYSGSFRLGTLRMRETLNMSQTPSARLCALLDQNIRRTIEPMRQSVPIRQTPFLVALAGDTESSMAKLLPGWTREGHASVRMEGRSLAEKIVSMPVDQLMRRYHLPSQEAETAGNALLIYDRIARAFDVAEVLVTNRSLRRGLLLQMAGGETSLLRFSEQLTYAATALGRKYHFDEKHALHVGGLCSRLFQELQPEHRLEPRWEVLLRAGAILHDIGAFVSTGSHHKHSFYLILHSEIFSLPREETALVALLARYHRRAMPRPSHPEYMALRRDQRIAVLKLAAVLRVADALDRSHTQRYRDLAFRRDDRRFIITVGDVEDITIERAALRDKADMFSAVYGVEVVLQASQALKGTGSHA